MPSILVIVMSAIHCYWLQAGIRRLHLQSTLVTIFSVPDGNFTQNGHQLLITAMALILVGDMKLTRRTMLIRRNAVFLLVLLQ
jgi:hypothetical protein